MLASEFFATKVVSQAMADTTLWEDAIGFAAIGQTCGRNCGAAEIDTVLAGRLQSGGDLFSDDGSAIDEDFIGGACIGGIAEGEKSWQNAPAARPLTPCTNEVQDPKFYADTTLKGVEPELLKAAGGAVCEISVPPLPTMDEMGERLARLSPAAEQAAELILKQSASWEAMGARRGKRIVPRTTVSLRHLPLDVDEKAVCDVLDQLGFQGLYDAVYVPFRFEEHSTPGEVLVNFVRSIHAEACIQMCHGRAICSRRPSQMCQASFAWCQGADFVTRCLSSHMRTCEVVYRAGRCLA